MKDIKNRIEKLLMDAEDCDIIAKLATSAAKRQAFENLAVEYRKLASDLEKLIASGDLPGDLGI